MATQVVKKSEVNKVDNQVVKKSEVNNQVTKTFGMDDSVNVFNIVWDGWLYSAKLAQAYQREMGKFAFQAFVYQKDIWMQASENIEKVEHEINQYMVDTKSYFLESLKTLNLISISKNVEEWNKLVEEVTNYMQQLYGTPGKVTSNLLKEYFDQMESTLKATIQQQQEISDENQALLENFIDQVKKTI
jgi:DNA integrity scanning protein DisA with diadenylate cyclase activity